MKCKNTKLNDLPHYTDTYYREPRTIFGNKEKGLQYDYSDRLEEWDYSKAQKAREKVNQDGITPHTAEWYERYLQYYFDCKIELKHILAGHKLSNGYSYQIFGYKKTQTKGGEGE